MEKKNLNQLFDHLIKDKESDIQTKQVIRGDVSLMIAELKAGKRLPAHYHTKGGEIYQVISGKGRIELGKLAEDNKVEWNEIFDLQAGDVLEVDALTVHRLLGGREDLRLIFITPPSHLGEDRIFVD